MIVGFFDRRFLKQPHLGTPPAEGYGVFDPYAQPQQAQPQRPAQRTVARPQGRPAPKFGCKCGGR